jgi:hypothetical protein
MAMDGIFLLFRFDRPSYFIPATTTTTPTTTTTTTTTTTITTTQR